MRRPPSSARSAALAAIVAAIVATGANQCGHADPRCEDGMAPAGDNQGACPPTTPEPTR